MTAYVLVHGAWSGAHGFRRLRRPLHAAGHEVFTPSLTGIGERAHLTGPQVGLTTHIHDLVGHVLYEDHHDMVLVGFSYGGAVITGALPHIGDRVRHLVYLDAFVPADGESIVSMIGAPSTGSITLGQEWLAPPPPREYDDPDEAAFMSVRRVPHPIGCFTEPVRVPRPLEDHPFQRTYIRAIGDSPDAPGARALDAAAAHADRSAAWRYREIAGNHMVASNRPEELVAMLLEMA